MTRVLKLQMLHPAGNSVQYDVAFLSSFSVVCPVGAQEEQVFQLQ